MTSFNVIIAGGRAYTPQADDYLKLDMAFLAVWAWATQLQCLSVSVIEGGARGADALGRQWAQTRGLPVQTFPADWDNLGRKAGFLRNQAMAQQAHALVAFPGGRGTQHMRNQAALRHLPICELYPNQVWRVWPYY